MANFDADVSKWLVFPGSGDAFVPPMREDFAFCADPDTGVLYVHGGIDLTAKGGRSAKMVQFDFRRILCETAGPPVGDALAGRKMWRRVKFARPASSVAVAPKARASHAMVAHDGGLFLFGGEGAFPPKSSGTTSGTAANTPRVIFGDFFRFDIASASWQRFSGNSPSPRRGHSLTKVTLRSCKEPFLIVFGGCGPDKLYRQDTFHADLLAVSLAKVNGSSSSRSTSNRNNAHEGQPPAEETQRRPGTGTLSKKPSFTSKAAEASSSRRNSAAARAGARAGGGGVVEPVHLRWEHVRVHGGAEDEDRNLASQHMTAIELEVQGMIRGSVPCARAGHTLTFVASSETLFLIGGVAPQVRATPKGTVSFQDPHGRTHNFAPATVHALKLSAVKALRSSALDPPHGPEQDDDDGGAGTGGRPETTSTGGDAGTRLAGMWTQVTPSGRGPGEITGHTAVVDPTNDRYIYVYGGLRRRSRILDSGMYVLDTQALHWTYIPAPNTDSNNAESLFLQRPVRDAVVPAARRNHAAAVVDSAMVVFGGCNDGGRYAPPAVYYRPLRMRLPVHRRGPYSAPSRPSTGQRQAGSSSLPSSSSRPGSSGGAAAAATAPRRSMLQRQFRFQEFVCNSLVRNPALARQLLALPPDASIEARENVIKRHVVKQRSKKAPDSSSRSSGRSGGDATERTPRLGPRGSRSKTSGHSSNKPRPFGGGPGRVSTGPGRASTVGSLPRKPGQRLSGRGASGRVKLVYRPRSGVQRKAWLDEIAGPKLSSSTKAPGGRWGK